MISDASFTNVPGMKNQLAYVILIANNKRRGDIVLLLRAGPTTSLAQ